MPDAMSWLGMRIDDAYGARVGDVEDVYLETAGTPRWLFARPCRVLIPAEEAMAGAGRVWVPYEKELIRGAPAVTSLDQVTPEHEAATARWYKQRVRSGWVAHGSVPWVRGYDAEAARLRREELRREPPREPEREELRAEPPPEPEPEPLPPLRQAGAAPPARPAAQQQDGRQVVMVFNIGCDEPSRTPLRATADGWDEAAARALDEYARRTGSYR